MDPLCLQFSCQRHSLQDASITEPEPGQAWWVRLLSGPLIGFSFTGCSSSPPITVFKGLLLLKGLMRCIPYGLTYHIPLCLVVFIVFLIMIFFGSIFSLTFAHFNPRSSLALYVFVSCLLSLPPVVPRLQYSPGYTQSFG